MSSLFENCFKYNLWLPITSRGYSKDCNFFRILKIDFFSVQIVVNTMIKYGFKTSFDYLNVKYMSPLTTLIL